MQMKLEARRHTESFQNMGVSLCTQMRSPCLSLLSSLGCWCAAPFSRDWQFSSKVNETDTFGPREDDEIQFDDVGDDDEDIDDI
ncbi:uncharacterized protein isoform X3 [Castor canadensis]|uniref:Uncharacterized protein isoform X3 n=2 Tax=Castor canadensis TaxID=51338 RepID=A0AC58LT92_CASCN